MKSTDYNLKKILSVFLFAGLMFFAQSVASAQTPTPTCPPEPEPPSDEEVVEKPYSLSYGFKASDRKFGSPDGLSTQVGTFSFSIRPISNVALRIANQNFIVGRDATGNRAVNFGNTTFTVDYTPFNESTKWTDDRHTPTVTFEYAGTFPTGSRSRGINVGRVDHDFTVAIEKMVGKRLGVSGDKENFTTRSSVETDFGVSLSANEGGGYNKTGNFVLAYNHLFGDIEKDKYRYTAEFDWFNLSNKARAGASLLNRMSFKFDDNGTRFVAGFTNGLTRGVSRFSVNLSIVFNGKFVWKKKTS